MLTWNLAAAATTTTHVHSTLVKKHKFLRKGENTSKWRPCQVLCLSKLQALSTLSTHLVYSCIESTLDQHSSFLHLSELQVLPALSTHLVCPCVQMVRITCFKHNLVLLLYIHAKLKYFHLWIKFFFPIQNWHRLLRTKFMYRRQILHLLFQNTRGF